jgi:uncharacterized protein
MPDKTTGRKANRLEKEKSPYLLQHRFNPVDWYPWGGEAFARARAEDRPVFLSVGYAACHWCHVMERESFESEEVARMLNESFVSIKVDREERPDIDRVYMSACQAMTGTGGWPLTIIMTPEGKPFFAATYIPRESAGGRMGLVDMLGRVAVIWKERRADIESSAGTIAEALARGGAAGNGIEGPGREEIEAAFRMLTRAFDRVNGGFGGAPKFPSPHTLIFLVRHARYAGSGEALDMALTTLRHMRRGGIFDQVGYGFHRYSTDERWLVPHFEKMLYDQAMMALAYLEAFHASGEPWCAEAAREIFEYVTRDMTAPEGGFYSAEDADSGGAEGGCYLWTAGELDAVLGIEDAAYARRVFNVEESGNYFDEAAGRKTGGNILHLSADPGDRRLLESARGRLFAARSLRPRPLLDDKVLADWNGLMIAALASGARILGDGLYGTAAARAASFIMDSMRVADGRLLHRYRDGDASVIGNLDDYAFFAWGLLELYAALLDPRHLEEACRCAALMRELFAAPGGGLFFTPSDGERLIARSVDYHDGAYPSGISVAQQVFSRLGGLTGDPAWERASQELFRSAGDAVRDYPAGHCMLLAGLHAARSESCEVVLAGDPENPAFLDMLARVRSRYAPECTLLVKLPGADGERIGHVAPHTAAMNVPVSGAAAYVCRAGACSDPVYDGEALDRLLPLKKT